MLIQSAYHLIIGDQQFGVVSPKKGRCRFCWRGWTDEVVDENADPVHLNLLPVREDCQWMSVNTICEDSTLTESIVSYEVAPQKRQTETYVTIKQVANCVAVILGLAVCSLRSCLCKPCVRLWQCLEARFHHSSTTYLNFITSFNTTSQLPSPLINSLRWVTNKTK